MTAESIERSQVLYRKIGAGKPCAGHKMDIESPLCMLMGRVSIEDSLGAVDEIGSEYNNLLHIKHLNRADRNNLQAFKDI